jgi:predicted GNAT family N-acyltransferase
MSLTVAPAQWATQGDDIHFVRHAVFVIEQSIPAELEWDAADAGCQHVLARIGNRPVGTGRLTPEGKIGRMAVLKDFRSQGIGAMMLAELVELARGNGLEHVYLNAQEAAVAFYARHGFIATGPGFLEAGIPHQRMERKLSA